MKRWHYILLVILALFIITNPSVSSFKTYRGRNNYTGLTRHLNLFICSVYSDRGKEYLGAIGNFFSLEHQSHINAAMDSIKLADSARTADSIDIKVSDTTKKENWEQYRVKPKK